VDVLVPVPVFVVHVMIVDIVRVPGVAAVVVMDRASYMQQEVAADAVLASVEVLVANMLLA
jgi:hypothetical protein